MSFSTRAAFDGTDLRFEGNGRSFLPKETAYKKKITGVVCQWCYWAYDVGNEHSNTVENIWLGGGNDGKAHEPGGNRSG